MPSIEHRVQFDFEIDFSNGGHLQGREFRLDIDGDTIDDAALADCIVRDLRLLMVGAVRISNKRILREPHKRGMAPVRDDGANVRHVDLSHTIESGMITYKGLPAPLVCDWLSREQSRDHYAPGTEFQIGRIEMVANTGTYLDCPSHRYADGEDLSEVGIERLVGLDAIVVRVLGSRERAVTRAALLPYDVRGRAVLIHTGWDRHWRTDAYFENHPYLTADAAEHLRDAGARLVGIDSLNIDDTADRARPVHSVLLRAGIPIVEHLRGLDALPPSGFTFTAAPVKVKGMGTFPVRAYATVPH